MLTAIIKTNIKILNKKNIPKKKIVLRLIKWDFYQLFDPLLTVWLIQKIRIPGERNKKNDTEK